MKLKGAQTVKSQLPLFIVVTTTKHHLKKINHIDLEAFIVSEEWTTLSSAVISDWKNILYPLVAGIYGYIGVTIMAIKPELQTIHLHCTWGWKKSGMSLFKACKVPKIWNTEVLYEVLYHEVL